MEFLTGGLWPTLKRLVAQPGRNLAAVAYLADSSQLPLRRGDLIVVNADDNVVTQGQTNPHEIEKLTNRGVLAYSVRNLHAKVFVLGRSLVVCSANVSWRSSHGVVEAGMLSRDTALLRQAKKFITRLAVEELTPEALKRLKRIYRPPRFPAGGGRGKPRDKKSPVPQHSRTWFVGDVKEAADSPRDELIRTSVEEAVSRQLSNRRRFRATSVKLMSMGNYACARLIKRGDRIAIGSKDGAKRVICAPAFVRSVRRYGASGIGRRVMIGYEEDRHGAKFRGWSSFRKAISGVGLDGLKPGSTREIRPDAVNGFLSAFAEAPR